MLAEGFLRVLLYREKRKFASTSNQHKTQTCTHCPDPFTCIPANSERQTDASGEGLNQEGLDSTQTQGLSMLPQHPAGLSIPVRSPAFTLDPDLTVCIDDCSLLEQYPDLQVVDTGRISQNLLKAISPQYDLYPTVTEVQQHPELEAMQVPNGDPVTSMPDQGYLVMGDNVNISLDLPGSGLEPMSNSLLNGLLDKQLEEVYMQHLTENLARYNSHLANSLLHGLVPPPQPSDVEQGLNSLEASLEGTGGDTNRKISYLSAQNLSPYSSNFSSPVLRISETDNTHQQ